MRSSTWILNWRLLPQFTQHGSSARCWPYTMLATMLATSNSPTRAVSLKRRARLEVSDTRWSMSTKQVPKILGHGLKRYGKVFGVLYIRGFLSCVSLTTIHQASCACSMPWQKRRLCRWLKENTATALTRVNSLAQKLHHESLRSVSACARIIVHGHAAHCRRGVAMQRAPIGGLRWR